VISLPQAAVSLRIARRDAWRHKVRSVLVISMVALPVLGLTTADVLARTMQLSPSQRVTREIGQASAGFQILGGKVTQGVDAYQGASSSAYSGASIVPGTPRYDAILAKARALLPANARLVELESDSDEVGARGSLVSSAVFGLDLADPLTAGISERVAGRPAAIASEVAISPSLAGRLGVGIGDQVTVGGAVRKVVGLYRDPAALRAASAWESPADVSMPSGGTPLYLVASSQPVTWAQVLQLNAIGVSVTSRYAVTHPPQHTAYDSGSTNRAETIGIATVAVGLAILEVVLLAGAAFAVGARRQRRDLALLAAAGGDAGHVRAVVVAGGIVLGLTGAIVGVAGGIASAGLLLSPFQRLANSQAGPFDLHPLELLAVAVLGIITGILASVLPARAAARDDVVAALTGRRGTVSTARRVPQLGLAMIVVGAFVAAYAAHPPVRFTLILVGAVISELGFVVCAPALVGLVGRYARYLPLAPRLALRDASRHRGRTGPAVAAIMAAVAGSIAISTYVVSEVASERANYQPQARIGQTLLDLYAPRPQAMAKAVAMADGVARRDLNATGLLALPTLECNTGTCHSADLSVGSGLAQLKTPTSIAVGGASLLAALTGRNDPGAVSALAAGKLVVFTPALIHGGRVGLELQNPKTDSQVSVDAYAVDAGSHSAATGAIMGPALAAQLHRTVTTARYLVTTSRLPSQAQQDKANAALSAASTNSASVSLVVERGYHPQRWGYGLLALAAAAVVVTLGATGITTGLSVAESRPDLATLMAVGGAPRTRRAFIANQAGVVALLGTVTGVVSGLVPAYGILKARPGFPFVLPWDTIAVVVVVVPILAMLATAFCISPRVRLDRRAT
jgi:putative ABC transport system permease protein